MAASDDIFKETYESGDYIFFEGDLESHFYIIEKGQVQIFTKNKQGKRINILTAEAGESFGEFALLDKKPRSASAQALCKVSLIKVSEVGYEELLENLPMWASSMMKSFTARLRKMTEVLKDSDQFIARNN